MSLELIYSLIALAIILVHILVLAVAWRFESKRKNKRRAPEVGLVNDIVNKYKTMAKREGR